MTISSGCDPTATLFSTCKEAVSIWATYPCLAYKSLPSMLAYDDTYALFLWKTI